MGPLALLGRLRGRSVAELCDRAAQATRALAERAGIGADLGIPTPAEALAELRDPHGRPFPSAVEAHEALTAPGARVLVGALADRAATLRALAEQDPDDRGRCLAAAERIASGRFDLLGIAGLDWGTPIDWHLDPVAGTRAPDAHWSQINFLDPAVAGDHKVTWEVNRHQWLVTLAQAWWYTGDERWAELALAHLDRWIDANPCKRGVNWSSSLEVGLRSIAWVWTLQLLRGSRALRAERHVRILGVLARSGRHVADNLSTWFSPNTHLTGEALALLAIGCGVPGLRDAARFRDEGAAILETWMPRHVRDDGTYVEQSTWYARYTADFLIHAIVMGEQAGHPLDGMRAALDRIATMLLNVSRADGTFPLLGDDDGGRLLFLDHRPATDLRPTLASAAALLGRDDLAWGAGLARGEPVWLLGAAGGSAMPDRRPHQPETTSRAFPDGGIYVMRDGWGQDASMAVIDCGPHGFRNGGHAHADLLAVDLTLGGRPVVRDPGTYTYTVSANDRDAWRSANMHGAVTVDGVGSAMPSGFFTWQSRPSRVEAQWGASDVGDALLGTHDGFASLGSGASHQRAVVRVPGAYWAIIDRLDVAGRHELAAHLPLAAGLTADLRDLEVRDASGAVAHLSAAGANGSWDQRDGWQSSAYGQRSASTVLSYRSTADGPQAIATVIRAAESAQTTVERAGESAFLVRSAAWDDLILVGADHAETRPAVSVLAAFAWLRLDRGTGKLSGAMLLGATRLVVEGVELFASTAAVPFASARAGAAPGGPGWTTAALSAFAAETTGSTSTMVNS